MSYTYVSARDIGVTEVRGCFTLRNTKVAFEL